MGDQGMSTEVNYVNLTQSQEPLIINYRMVGYVIEAALTKKTPLGYTQYAIYDSVHPFKTVALQG
jgi:hypothetical protein